MLHGSHLHAPLPDVSQLLLVSSGLVTLVLSWWPLTTVDNVLILSSGVGVYRLPEHNLKHQILIIIRVECHVIKSYAMFLLVFTSIRYHDQAGLCANNLEMAMQII